MRTVTVEYDLVDSPDRSVMIQSECRCMENPRHRTWMVWQLQDPVILLMTMPRPVKCITPKFLCHLRPIGTSYDLDNFALSGCGGVKIGSMEMVSKYAVVGLDAGTTGVKTEGGTGD